MPRRRRSARRCAPRRCPTPSVTRSVGVTPSWRRRSASIGRRSRSARARSARTAPEATFAGQQETYLWVRGADHVCDAVRDCWVSLYSTPAMTYRARLARPGEPAMGVTVQLMVDAGVSGVLFTCNPVSGDPSMVAVNASWGLGLAVVGGEVTPDDYLVSKVTREVVRAAHPRQGRPVPFPTPQVAAPSRRSCRGAPRGLRPSTRQRSPRSSTRPARASATSAAIRTSSGRSQGPELREPVRRAVATGHRRAAARAGARAESGDGARDEHVRRRETKS